MNLAATNSVPYPACRTRSGRRRLVTHIGRAVAGDLDALRLLATDAGMGVAVRQLRISSLLARLAYDAGIDTEWVASWLAYRRSVTAQWLLFEHFLERAGDYLGRAGVPWVPLKGADLAFRAYDSPDDRPASDLDILVAPEHLGSALASLRAAGWKDRWETTPGYLAFVGEEAHNWSLVCPEGVMVEVHFRLWGFLPSSLIGVMLDGASQAGRWGRSQHLLQPADAAIVSAAHAWAQIGPYPPLTELTDLFRIGLYFDGQALARGLVEHTKIGRTEALVGAMLRRVVDFAGGRGLDSSIDALQARAAIVERLAWRALQPHAGSAAAVGAGLLLRLILGRPSRQSWRSFSRRLHPHPGNPRAKLP